MFVCVCSPRNSRASWLMLLLVTITKVKIILIPQTCLFSCSCEKITVIVKFTIKIKL